MVPINIRIDEWDVEHPPADGTRVVARRQFIDVLRSSSALLGFGLLLVGLARQALQLPLGRQPRKTGFPVFPVM